MRITFYIFIKDFTLQNIWKQEVQAFWPKAAARHSTAAKVTAFSKGSNLTDIFDDSIFTEVQIIISYGAFYISGDIIEVYNSCCKNNL